MQIVSEGFHGVYSPQGELKAVEGTLAMAQDAARNLSPAVNGKPPLTPNRTVTPVTVIAGDFYALIEQIIGEAFAIRSSLASVKNDAAASELAAMVAEASATKSPLPDGYWQSAHAAWLKSRVADAMAATITGAQR